jgi:hypothetical protein
LAKELSYCEEAAAKEFYSLNPKNINWDSLGLGDFNFDFLSFSDISESSLGVIRC